MLILVPLPFQLSRIAPKHIKLMLDKLEQISQTSTASSNSSLRLRLRLRRSSMCRMRAWMLLLLALCTACTSWSSAWSPAAGCDGRSVCGGSGCVCGMHGVMRRMRRVGWMDASERYAHAHAGWE